MAGNPSAAATVTVTVGPVTLPMLIDDVATTPEDTALIISIGVEGLFGLLQNDSDADMDIDPSSFTFTPPSSGALFDNGDGTLTFMPVLDFNGEATFTYSVKDDLGVNAVSPATVTIAVTPVNDDPIAEDDTAYTEVDAAVQIPVLNNDTDADVGDVLTATILTQSTNGTVTVLNSVMTYTPNSGFEGEDTFSYTVDDGNFGTAAMGSVTVLVQKPDASFEILGGTFLMPTVSPDGIPSTFGAGDNAVWTTGVYTGFFGDSPSDSVADPLFSDFLFFDVPVDTYTQPRGVDNPNGPDHPPISIDLQSGTANMSSFYAYWNGTEFTQGDANAVVNDNNYGTYTI
jgi:hypothetical protein